MNGDPEWFAPKRFGIGAGLPISREGWAVSIGYLMLIGLAAFLIQYSWIAYISVVVMLTAVFIVICIRTTRGGWRWRWGGKD